MSYTFNRPNITDRKLSYSEYVKLMDMVEMVVNAKYSQDFYVARTGKQMYIALDTSAGINLDKLDFWYRITNRTERKVKINKGILRIGLSVFLVPETEIQITADPTYVFVQYDRAQASGPTIEISTEISDVSPTGQIYRHLLYTLEITTEGGVRVQNIHHIGSIQTGTYWG